jgi:hypothetical protein
VKQTKQDQLEDYLKTATRGLFGKHKLEVQEELQAHVLERARNHELLGLDREVAISKSIQELGDARVINRHMMGVYVLSKQLLLGGVCACALVSFGFWQMTKATVLHIECSNADQSFHFSGITTGKYSRLNLPDKSVIATAINGRTWTAKNINTTFGESPSITSVQIQAQLASFEAPGHNFGFSDVDMKTVTRNGKSDPKIRCEFR